tara:strand:- start:423 stop:740 length:318 start_codon:yes stop_codon:yes gene_type:complete
MSLDLRLLELYPSFKTFQAGSAGIATKILLPSSCKRVQVGSHSGSLFISHTGEDGQMMSAIDRGFIPQNNLLTINIGTGKERLQNLFVAGQAGSEVVVIILEETI